MNGIGVENRHGRAIGLNHGSRWRGLRRRRVDGKRVRRVGGIASCNNDEKRHRGGQTQEIP
jgi:hypothetical protein